MTCNYIFIISCLQVFQIKSEIHVLYIQEWSYEADFIKLWQIAIIENINQFEPKLKQYFVYNKISVYWVFNKIKNIDQV
jgi:hypothetical protein